MYEDIARTYPKRKKFTAKDIDNVLTESLFKGTQTWTREQSYLAIVHLAKQRKVPVSKALSKDYEFYRKSKK
jgi:hypothetical protein